MSTVTYPRRVVLDDRDPRIIYSPNQWLGDSGSRDKYGNNGPTWLHTETVTRENGSLSFSYAGSSIWVYGTVPGQKIGNNTYDPSWECYVDNVKIALVDFNFDTNGQPLCKRTSLDEGNHVVTVNVTTSQGNTFYVDSIQYRPTQTDDPLLNNVIRFVDGEDKSYFSFNGNWTFKDSLAITQLNGATVKFDFNGTGFVWMYKIPTPSPIIPATITYILDDHEPVQVNLPTLSNEQSPSRFNIPLINISDLSPSTHTFTVTYNGNSSTTPLTLDAILLNSTLVDSGSSSGASNSTSRKPRIAGAVVGGVLGALALIAIVLGLLLWRKKRKQSRNNEDVVRNLGSPGSVAPFTVSDTQPCSPSRTAFSGDSSTSWGNSLITPRDHATSSSTAPLRPLHKGVPTDVRQLHEGQIPQVISHQDSGIRIPQDEGPPVVEIPPMYSPH